MTTTEQKSKINKLPNWARLHIKHLSMEREEAIRTLNEFCDTETPTRIWVDEHTCTGEEIGPRTKRHYIQGHTVTFYFSKDHRQDEDTVDIRFNYTEPDVIEIVASRALVFRPWITNVIRIQKNTVD